MSKIQSRNENGRVNEFGRIDPIGSAAVDSRKIIEFEIAKAALEQGHQDRVKTICNLDRGEPTAKPGGG